jgi:hypothetical protein
VNLPSVVDATLLVAAGVTHSYLGERHILLRLFSLTNLAHLFCNDVFTKRTLRLAWHATGTVITRCALVQG